MFAILLSDSMNLFYETISSFPTIIFTILLGACVVYWLFAVIGVLDIDVLDFGGDFGGDGGGAEAAGGGPNAVAGLLMRFKLAGVPVTIVLTFVTLFAWLISCFSVYLLFPLIPGTLLEYLAGIPIAVGSLWLGLALTGFVIKPLKPLFSVLESHSENKTILGKLAIVRSSIVDQTQGEAILDSDGAALVLKVRAADAVTYERGDRVIAFDHDEPTNTYLVMSETEFENQ